MHPHPDRWNNYCAYPHCSQQCNFLYDAEVACFDGVAAIGVSIHIVEDGGNPLWLLCIIGGEKLTADSF